MTNKKDGVLYTGVTSDLPKRVYEHQNSSKNGFSAKYNCQILAYYEVFENMENAILREKEIKSGSKKRRFSLLRL